MKNLSLILNAVLLVAVAVLFYLQFARPGTSGTDAGTAAPGEVKLAFINSDSVLKYYDYFKVNRDRLEDKAKKMDNEFRNRAQSLQNEFNNYQRNLSNLTIGQAKAIEQDLANKEQNLQVYRQSLAQDLSNEQTKMNDELYTKVTGFLKSYGQEKGLSVVLKFDQASDVLYAGESIDITKDVIAGLNSAYQAEKQSPAKADSTAAKKK
ncbi:MAG: OmpH family outer membrane protein [Cyclobacteriaceae bacterium]|jgi:outer membrane protein|nr:OmpH family outer membrane protein [Flammeovirgaceae bacterium]